MAEKEERIYVFKFEDDPCKDCEVKEINPDCSCCLDKKEYSRGLTRLDAIERIAKGIARQYDPDRPNAKEYERIWDEELLDRVKQSFRKKAEAALNALLEEQDER